MAGIQVAESKTPKKGRKVLSHLEIHPRLGGGHVVRHVLNQYEEKPKEYEFKKDEGQRAMAHIARHAGLPAGGGAVEPEEAEEAGED